METVASPLSATSANGTSPVAASALSNTVDPSLVLDYLASVVGIALGSTREELERPGNLLSPDLHSDTLQRCSRFATDSQVALYIQKEAVVPEDVSDDLDGEVSTSYIYSITSEFTSSSSIVAYLALLKRPQAIDPSLPLSSQIQIQTLPGTASLNSLVADQGPSASPFEILHSIVHNALAPYFDANTKTTQNVNGARSRADVDAKTGIPVTKKRMTELELSLLHLQQNVEIPELSLSFHPVVQAALDDAAMRNMKPTTDFIDSSLLSDSSFMNNLQSTVNGWIKSIQAITKLTRDPVTRTATQEINFWLSMESALEGIEAQLRSEGVMLTLEILKHAKRFQATVSFTADTGLKEAMEMVQKYNQLMRDFPLDELLSATSLPKVQDAIAQIFGHMNKKMRFSTYPIARTLHLVEAVSADLEEVVHRLLPGAELVDLDYKDFKNLMVTADEIFKSWDAQIKEFTNIARETTRRRQEKFIPIKVNPKHSELQARLKYIDTFRDNHEQLQRTIVNVLGPKATVNGVSEEPTSDGVALVEEMGDVDAVEEAWEALKNVDLLDVTPEGTQRWVKAENTYNERTSRVENSIIARLRDRLATAKNANEMFRVFSQFNALFVRPKIRGAIAEYQNQLIENVKQAISALHERFKQQYGHSEAHAMAQLHDLPPVSGAIIWARQIERQLDGYMKKVEDILGSDWALHTEGQKLQTESELFRKKLNTQAIYKAWIEDVQRKQITIAGRLFNINKVRAANNALDLSVNFDAQIIALFKETRNLGWQNFNVPNSVNNVAKEAKRVYPYAVSLMESVRTFAQTTRQISEMPDVAILLSGYQNEVHVLIAKGVPLKWETFVNTWESYQKPFLPNGALDHTLGRGSESKHVLFVREFAAAASLLQSKTIALAVISANIQKALAELATCPYEASEFAARLQTIQAAVDQLNLEQYVNLGFWVERMNEKIKLTLLARLQRAISTWIEAFEDETPIDQLENKRRKQVAPTGEPVKSDTPIMAKLVHEITMRNQVIYLDPPLEYARASWFEHLHDWVGIVCNLPKIKASRYQMSLTLGTLVHEEARFDELPADCTDILGRSMEKKLTGISEYVDKWLQFQSLWDLQSEQLLGDELSKWLQLLQEIRKSRATFDTTEVSRAFGHIIIDYDQVQLKYDQWQHEILIKFAGRLGTRMREIEKARKDLESQNLEATSTAHAVQFITIRQVKLWAPEVETFRQGQSTLLPADWQVDSSWESLNELLTRKAKITDALKAKIVAEDQVVINEIATQWNEEKPVSGTIAPEVASFETRITKLQEESDMAKEALDLPASPESSLAVILEEVHDFNLSTIWKSLNELRETLWGSIRGSIDGLIKMTKEMPSRMRQYAAFEHIQNILRQHLKSEAIRDRHWAKIWKEIKPGRRYSPVSMTLGDVWDLNLVATEVIGEMALEEFLKQTWNNYQLELVPYQNKCRLIRGWDDLFAKCSENLNSLQAMKHSPYYKEFEEEASSWEDKLNRVHVLFDVWIDVQRQWGVFTGNADIKHLLPIDEFMAVMKKAPMVMDVLAIAGSLERLAELLNKIQKALGEYLEKERVSFPRFYFDLLEMIGNSNDTLRIAKHFKKMFAGLNGLVMDDETTISGFTSKENEVVRLKKEISLAKVPRINDWLALLENGMKATLAELLAEAVDAYTPIFESETIDQSALNDFMGGFPSQIVVLATQVVWTTAVERSLTDGGKTLQTLFEREVQVLGMLAETVLGDLEVILRKKCEALITECVHQRDCIEKLVKLQATTPTHYFWLLQMRYVYSPEGDFLQRLHIKMANAKLNYGFEYLGVPDRLVRTPLTDRCFLTLTQALCQRLGGSPYGPAGTGKTESVKALGVQLGRFTLVFCCDDTFDFQAMGRIFLGICQVGAWGCFDEFNRLEERILSAVSQQIQNIQLGLKQGSEDDKAQIELVGRQLRVNANTGIFITMNPGYAGRSNLPDNLKKLFRSVAMSKPDKELIAEVMLYSQGFNEAKQLSKNTVPFFDQCSKKLSKQAHYDFGLRALKSVLVSSGGLKRARLTNPDGTRNETLVVKEPEIIVQSIRETIAPKLIRSDVEIMVDIEEDCFPGVQYVPANLQALEEAIRRLAGERHLVVTDTWMTKILQLFQIQKIHHGVMMVGNSGTGKSAAWRLLLDALQQVEGVEGVSHVIDSKVMSKEALYGNLDSTTREWTDGLFTSILRKIVDNLRGEDSKRHWIVFDGDVDPEWVENLNSVLDDNKLLTLPNGERLNLPANVRIMFEVETLKYATLATVSRCGMVWYSEDTVTSTMLVDNYLDTLRTVPFEDLDEDTAAAGQSPVKTLQIQSQAADLLQAHMMSDNFILEVLKEAEGYNHIMDFTVARVLNTLFSLLNKAVRDMIEYNAQHFDFPLDPEQVEAFVSKKLLLALVWALTGDCPLLDRKAFGDKVGALASFGSPPLDGTSSLIDFDVSLPRAEWTPWQNQVPTIEVNTHSTDVVIPTLDTDVLYSWLAEHKPLLLCGPPGSGKTMTLFSALRKLPNMEVVGLNFSSATTPDLLIKTFEQYCEYKKTLNGIGRWLVIFCDEINLPAPDKYGTQRAISFLRQMVEHNGFWRTSDKVWVTLDRIQFVDAGRTPLGARFLRHAPLIMVDYPGELSLMQIYGTFNTAIIPALPMVRFYLESQQRFTPKIQPHYLTRWVRAIKPLESLTIEGLVRIWAHEALRLFQDRLDERQWTDEAVRRIALEFFPTIDESKALGGPNYVPVDHFVKARLKTFCEEEVDVPLILFNEVLEHVLRIDRPQGHLILIGVSGSGKTTLSRFVAWMNGLKIKYSAEDFDDDLRDVLRRCGCKGEKICFIMDESNRMNTLLANAEVPGDDLAALMTACKEGLLLDSQEELYKWFTGQIVKNLHVDGLSSKAATSPALFNRCVLNWFGDWSDQALYQLTYSIDLDKPNFVAPDSIPVAYRGLNLPPSHRETIVNSMRFNTKLQKQQGKVTFLTPRHFLDFYVKLYNEKREDLEEQQRHLNLKDTVEKVRDLRVSLAEKKTQLEAKDAEANEKLQRMREAEQRKNTSLEIQAALEKQESEEVVLNDLARAEPAVEAAKASRQHLTEVRSMGNPPQGSVCTLLGHPKVDDWRNVQADDFIASIVNFDNEKLMTKSLRTQMRTKYLNQEDFTFEKVNRASKACGPLVQWVEAQILDRVGPLREEVDQLEDQALQTKAEAKAVENTIVTLEQSIATYKTDETQAIKAEMLRVQSKVDRSVRLLDSLSSERTQGSKSFETQINTLVGDVLVAAAFLAYSGLYDQTFRKSMMEDWLHQLHLYKQHNPMTEYLSTADERLGWQENTLPNAIILQRFNRYPLIIDPSGRFLQRECKDRRLTVTSFLDDSFTKQLESSLRFGNPILIQDAEHLDPILNHEYQKTGGRLGKQQIDFSPSFKIYLSTRDPSATFPPDICSRTTFVNFTSSLQTQSLNDVLKSERPDRRSNLIKLQGEFKLEKRLLQALNESRGNILDDDNTLETLKTEAAEISTKMSNTEGVMAEVEEITQHAVFALHYLNHFYQFSLQYFLDIFHSVLHGNKNLANETDFNLRRDIIIKDLFVTTYKRTALGLLQKDRIALAMLLAQASPYNMDKGLIDVILDGRVEGVDLSTHTDAKDAAFVNAKKLPALKDRLDNVPADMWDKFLTEELAENYVPQIWESDAEPADRALLSLLLVKMFRLDRFVPTAEAFVTSVFGEGLFDIVEDLKSTVDQVSSTRPISLTSSPGFDASYKVDSLVERMRVRCNNIAMGSNESVASADKAISNAAQVGSWVLVKNVHLAPTWLQSLEKRMESLNPHSDFRLFLSMESSPKIPVNFLRASRVLMYEQPAGVRANMKDSISSLSTRASRSPVERARYECSAFIIDTWVDTVAQSRSNIAPQNIPWEMIRYLVREMYGGKIDDEEDFKRLTELVDSLLTPAAFDLEHKLVESSEKEAGLVVPAGTTMQDFSAWVHKLPEREPPTYLGLPANAEKLLLVGLGRNLMQNLKKVTELLDEGEQLID
ncbi:LOW QUALITY PROTEIN: dynein heavy chain, N-terminal region 1-domain-containing protein [Microdochium trichocladiopsis]|uniref:Dynein heavy chain, cytoplasmic n=1 Tax=Microdochium trichocladiopsis TaxID=1682393 RepID=A0A9P8Y6M8_9PEZI|nr:LOW QUALITY PROTEIN: dynein heavy chain, N-terminal region 1-domain-containing protein [Microdochium trichocladiopsis]KAH7030898.1 LOW QUALITY PROTEIN: dynein heavy chain, N-terminal region 1-domain-containing protein [Microdochium trichocladiopsis]